MHHIGQLLNLQGKKTLKNSPSKLSGSIPSGIHQSVEKINATQTSLGDISQDLIKQLTLKNKLLTAQLNEYKTLVSNLNIRLQQISEQNRKLQELLASQEQQYAKTPKLHTIEEQMNSISEITTKSRRKEFQQVKQQYYFHEISQLLNSYQLINQNMSWQAYLGTIEGILKENRRIHCFIDRLKEMKENIEPGQLNIQGLWEWLKKIGLNYYHLIAYRRHQEIKYH